jgi:hypothetical protein
MRRNLENKKELTSIRIMNNTGLNTNKIMNSVGIFDDNVVMSSEVKE